MFSENCMISYLFYFLIFLYYTSYCDKISRHKLFYFESCLNKCKKNYLLFLIVSVYDIARLLSFLCSSKPIFHLSLFLGLSKFIFFLRCQFTTRSTFLCMIFFCRCKDELSFSFFLKIIYESLVLTKYTDEFYWIIVHVCKMSLDLEIKITSNNFVIFSFLYVIAL